MILVGPFQLN